MKKPKRQYDAWALLLTDHCNRAQTFTVWILLYLKRLALEGDTTSVSLVYEK